MFDFTSKALTNSLKSNLDDALKSGKVIVSIRIHDKDFPGKMYSRSLWVLEFDDKEFKIFNNKTKKVFQQISLLDIDHIQLNVAKGYNNAPGRFMTQTLCLEIAVNMQEKTYQFICEDLGVIKPMLSWLKENNIEFIDTNHLVNLYNEHDAREAVDILYSQIHDIQGR